MGKEEERDKEREEWLKSWIEDIEINNKRLMKLFGETEDELNDVYIYKTLRYPPKSTPPTAT